MTTEVGRKRKSARKPRPNSKPLFNHGLHVLEGEASVHHDPSLHCFLYLWSHGFGELYHYLCGYNLTQTGSPFTFFFILSPCLVRMSTSETRLYPTLLLCPPTTVLVLGAPLRHMNGFKCLCKVVPGSSCLLFQFTIHVAASVIFLRSKSDGVLLRSK